MIKIIQKREIAGMHVVDIEFKLFGSMPVIDVVSRKTDEGIAAYYEDIRRTVLLINFERHIIAAKERLNGEPSDRFISAMERLGAANAYFNDPKNNLSTEKIMSMITRLQNHLMSIQPSAKHPDYDRAFQEFNELIKFCKS